MEQLLTLLAQGERTLAELAVELRVPLEDVTAAITAFDAEGLLENADALGGLEAAEAERHFSNLAFLESFSGLERSREDLRRRIGRAHVLVLGTGGLNSNVIPHLAGLGVGKLTLLDRDTVDPRNFARQYLYRWADLGARKVRCAADWVRAFDPSIEVESIDTGIESPRQLDELVARTRPDVVSSGIDRPGDIDLWVNSACVRHGVPFVRGGMWVTSGTVWSVEPGVSACRACLPPNLADPDAPDQAAIRLYRDGPRPNRGIGPVAGLLGALAAFEVLRFLTRIEPPAYAGRPLVIDFAGACATSRSQWPRNPDCVECGRR